MLGSLRISTFICLLMRFCVSDFRHFPKSERTSDLGFRTYYQFALFTHEQLSEIYKPEDIRGTADWADLHLLKPDKFEMKKIETFLTASNVRRALEKCRLSGIQIDCCLQIMRKFYKYFCAELVNHTASQSPITRGVVCFDPQVLKDEPDTTGKPAFDLMANAMVRFNWIEQPEATLGRTEYDSLVVDLRGSGGDTSADSVNFFCETEFMDVRPNLYEFTNLLACA